LPRHDDGDADGDMVKLFKLERQFSNMNTRFGISDSQYICHFTQEGDVLGLSVLEVLLSVLNDVLETVLEGVTENELIQFSFISPRELDYPITLPFLTRDMLTVEHLLQYIANVLQSYKELKLYPHCIIKLVRVRNVTAKGFSIKSSLKSYIQTSRSLIKSINTESGDCFIEALALGLAFSIGQLYNKSRGDIKKAPSWLREYNLLEILWKPKPHIKIKKSKKTLKHLVSLIKKITGLKKKGVSVTDYKLIQTNLLSRIGFRLQVFNMRHSAGLSYSTKALERDIPGQNIYIYVHANHAYAIKTICGFLQVMYFCPYCLEHVKKLSWHKCDYACFRCGLKEGSFSCDGELIRCRSCNKYFQGRGCLKKHRDTGLCSKEKYCSICSAYIVRRGGEMGHRCGYRSCPVCRVSYTVGSDHLCYITPIWAKEEDTKFFSYIAFDCETMLKTDFDKKSSEHKVCCICATIVCKNCIDNYPANPNGGECGTCGKRNRIFFGARCVEHFCKFALRPREGECLILSHNGGSYDILLIQQYMYKENLTPNVICRGNRIITLSLPKFRIKFIDLIQFLPMSLANVHKSMNVTTAAKKGYGPYLLWNEENINRIFDHYPPKHYFNVNGMTKEKADDFHLWYEANKQKTYNVKKEMISYCINDVSILMEGAINFKNMFMKATRDINDRAPEGVNPFRCVTLASACARVFRACFLFRNCLGVIPPKVHMESQSVNALKWIKIVSEKEKIYIHHARNGKEMKIANYKVDGVYIKNGTKHIMSYLGCFFHGCEICHNHNEMNKIRKVRMGDLLAETKRIEREIKAIAPDSVYLTMWDCEFVKLLKTDVRAREIVDKYCKKSEPLNIKHALLGGRCENFRGVSNSTCKGGLGGRKFHLEHFDFTSMYPAVQCQYEYPLGHPIIHTERFPSDMNSTPQVYRGVIKCDILPPKGLFVPVLPSKINKKLHFTLCRTCSERCHQGQCRHNVKARTLTGTWTTAELQKSIECGYSITYIYEVWHWEEWSSTIFKDYIATFYKLKLAASGFPAWCLTDEDKERYIEHLRVNEGVTLDISDIKYNQGVRTICKGIINSLWGKLGEQLTHQKTLYTRKVSKLHEIMASSLDSLEDVYIVNDNIVRIQYKTDEKNTPPKIFQNIAIAAHVTSYGRLYLYEQLAILDRLLCYADTDSCIFIVFDDSDILTLLKIGDGLGKMISECGYGEYIVKFVSLGPKCYGYECNTGRQKLCVKGIPQKVSTSDVVTLPNMEKLIESFCDGGTTQLYVVYPYHIYKNVKTGVIKSTPLTKRWRAVVDKRVIDKKTSITYPFGFDQML
jgi:hypothetical protein